MKRIVRMRRKRIEPVFNPRFSDPTFKQEKRFQVPEDETARVKTYMFILSREKRGIAKRGAASAFRKKYLPDMTPQEALKKAREYEGQRDDIQYEVIEYGEKVLRIPEGVPKMIPGEYADPYSTVGKTSKPFGERKKDKREPIPVGPVQNALSTAGREYTRYMNQLEEEKDRDQIGVETRRRVELFRMLTRDLKTLLDMLRAETQETFLINRRQQRAKIVRVKRSGMLDRAMKMVVG